MHRLTFLIPCINKIIHLSSRKCFFNSNNSHVLCHETNIIYAYSIIIQLSLGKCFPNRNKTYFSNTFFNYVMKTIS